MKNAMKHPGDENIYKDASILGKQSSPHDKKPPAEQVSAGDGTVKSVID